MANSLESEAEKDERERKKRNIRLQSPTKQISGFALSEKKGVEVWKAIMFLMLGFYTERRKVFTLFFLPSKLSRHSA